MYSRNARLPTESVLNTPPSPYTVDLEDYHEELTAGLSSTWEITWGKIGKVQKRQKIQYDIARSQKGIVLG